MRNYILLFSLFFALAGCKMIAKEMKRSNEIRKLTRQACDCKYVGVNTSFSNSNKTLTLTIRRTNSNDYASIADSIMNHLENKYEKICGYGEVFILFETDSLTERYTYYGCDDEPEYDTFDPNELEDEELEDEELEATDEEDPII